MQWYWSQINGNGEFIITIDSSLNNTILNDNITLNMLKYYVLIRDISYTLLQDKNMVGCSSCTMRWQLVF